MNNNKNNQLYNFHNKYIINCLPTWEEAMIICYGSIDEIKSKQPEVFEHEDYKPDNLCFVGVNHIPTMRNYKEYGRMKECETFIIEELPEILDESYFKNTENTFNGTRKDITLEDLREVAKKMKTSEWYESERKEENERINRLLAKAKDIEENGWDAVQIREARERYAKEFGIKINDVRVFKPIGKPVSPAKSQKKPRNAKCACGSGKKNKNCCNGL